MEPLFEWKLPSKIPLDVLEQLASFPRVQQRLLYNRGIRDSVGANSYLRRQGSLYDPFLLDQMDLAVKTILQAIDSRMKIAVYGDYDVDGVTASALLIQVLTALGAEVRGYIPNRFEEGYGVNKEALHTLHEEGIALTITVDCGIRSPEEALFARSLGMELIITDHHEPGGTIPEAAAVICPKKPSDSYPDKNLAGVGLAYKLAEALLTTHPVAGIAAEDWEDFVAVGTVADMVSLTGENRSLVKSGLQKLRVSSRPCIRALAEVSGIRMADIKASTIGFSFGPRLNAAGRLETAKLAFDLLMSRTLNEARRFAIELNDQNRQRQELTKLTQRQVLEEINPARVPILIFSAKEEFNRGVVGLAASRLAEHFYRPAIVGSINGDEIHASCRSILEFHITDALDQCADLMVKHGGHAMAAGLTIKKDNWSMFVDKMTTIATQRLQDQPLKPVKQVDMEIPLDYLKENVLEQIAEMEPFGMDNPEPLFLIRNLKVASSRIIGNDLSHLRLKLISEDQITVDAVAFRQGWRRNDLPERIDVLGTFEKNTWKDQQTLQLNLVDFRSAVSN
ncbi:MAG TPA: single-stranded-DNA-specific exonuclease RecJ [Flexilinea sp.]|nr:single-stranded-DNA-specific exonuclease RecJ [Flexilinea sp.]HQJ01625.1 single-stranded-DNA-specific exonuclease RecJ [Flexilinea sp.]